MPCRGPDPSEDISDLNRIVDRLTKVACELAAFIRKNNKGALPPGLSTDTVHWIHSHDAADRLRAAHEESQKKREEARAKALSKLTREDRDLLGL